MSKEEKDMARVELNDSMADDVVGGNFNWWREEDGTRMCWVNGVGTYICTPDAKDTFAWLKAEHRGEGWTEQMYVDALIAAGDFRPE